MRGRAGVEPPTPRAEDAGSERGHGYSKPLTLQVPAHCPGLRAVRVANTILTPSGNTSLFYLYCWKDKRIT